MSPPRYRTLDGEEVELPLAMDRWVLVPRGLARFDPELAWTLDYEDAPEPEDADPRLDFSLGALLVPVDRWNEHAELEPNLGACRSDESGTPSQRDARGGRTPAPAPRGTGTAGPTVVVSAARGAALLLAALAASYVLAVGAWLWSLRDGITGPDLSTGVMLIGIAIFLAWVTGVAGAGSGRAAAHARGRTWLELGAAVARATDDPLAMLRLGLAVQVSGFAVLVLLR